NLPKTSVVSKALKELRRKEFFEQLATDADNLRSDPATSRAYDEEFKAWDATLSDGLEGR
ncbi:MAG: toxin-antitoxin system protein, partial [Actinomycetota bacterium]|nr:toxin-antitoxin system protein [Actinomycetota bacterium]